MHADFLLEAFQRHRESDAIIWRDKTFSFDWLHAQILEFSTQLADQGIAPGAVVSLEADFSPVAVASMVALIHAGAVVVPLTSTVEHKKPEFRGVAEVEFIARIDAQDEMQVERTGATALHPHLVELKRRGHPGLILFSSGSTGKSKAAVHDFVPMLDKYRVPRHAMRTLTFLLFDHIGGVNTLLYTLANGGTVVTVEDRNADAVCKTIEAHRVQLLPTSPTFLNLLLVTEAYTASDISSLEMITYGTEPMPQSTLERLSAALPDVRLLQTYGLSELGILRSKSKSSDSLWVKIGGEGFETRVVDGLLEIKAKSAMLGYLNAPSPFTDDGWFITGDAVEVDGEYLRILGRKSEIINVGGEKVYPAEVESVLQEMENVEDVSVVGEKSMITGQMVKAVVKVAGDETLSAFRKRMRTFCQSRLEPFKIPQKVEFATTTMHGDRFKKMRRSLTEDNA